MLIEGQVKLSIARMEKTYVFVKSRYLPVTPCALDWQVSAVLAVQVQVAPVHLLPAALVGALDDGKRTLL